MGRGDEDRSKPYVGAPTVTSGLVHLAGRVWLYPHDPDLDNVQGGIGVVADDRGSVVVDAGNSPFLARRVREAMDAAGLPAARWLVYTHHHWDHVWGAIAWGDVEIVAHAASRDLLAAEARRPWSHEYLRAEVARDPLLGPSFRARAWAMPSWDGFAVRPPDTVFDEALTLPTGVELTYVGGRHAVDSIVATVPDAGVRFLGDCFYPPPFHLRGDGDTHDLAMLRRLLRDDIAWYVDAHSAPVGADEVAAVLDAGAADD
jgi:glyoxylase-like metal-dependent hydrolase (beta-lactamase superfamily II)